MTIDNLVQSSVLLVFALFFILAVVRVAMRP